MKLLDQIERKMGRCYVPELMKYLCLAMAGVLVLDVLPLSSASEFLCFNRAAILRGEVWRVFTFMFVMRSSGLLTDLIRLYFYYFLGTSLERYWGSRKFNLYILIGWLCNAVCGFLVGVAVSDFLYATLLLAFAVLYPETQVMLFFVIPVKVKWLGWAAAAMTAYELIVYPPAYKLSLAFSLIPFFLFFWKDCYLQIKLWIRHIRFWLTSKR